MQLVMLQQDRCWRVRLTLVATQLRGVPEADLAAIGQGCLQRALADRIGLGVVVRRTVERGSGVEELPAIGDHLGATSRVVALATFGAIGFGDGIGAVQGIVQRAPAGVGCVEGVAGVAQWHHQLRAGLHGDLAVDVAGTDLHACRGLHKVADALEEVLVGGHVTDRAGVLAVPVVQLRLQALAFGEQGAVLRREVVDQGAEALPEGAGLDAGAGEGFVFDEALQGGGDLEWMVWHCLFARCSGFWKVFACAGLFAGLPAPKGTAQVSGLVKALWERASPRRGRYRIQRAAAPALATWASCSALTPDTPIAPTTCPSTRSGTPPSRLVSSGAVTKAVRPPLTISS
ncbi:hypothetical protein D3C75_687880 [compost metagenome]